jgi:GNAT superfamily N-acetyltransferase
MTSTTTASVTADGWDALLSDGGVVRIRPVTAADENQLHALHQAASDRSIYLRYFSLNRRSGDRYVDKILHGGKEEIILVAEEHGTVIGMAGCTRLDRTADAEIALLVDDAHQGRGVGTLLLEHLAAVARHAGIRSFIAETLVDNGLMQKVFTDAGFQVERRTDLDVTHVRMSLAQTPTA